MRKSILSVFGLIFVLFAAQPASADALAAGRAAFSNGDFSRAARLLLPLADRGNSRAQSMVGFMYATGQGLPQAYGAAAYWYRLAAEQGETTAQYLLGLAYDKGQGVPLDEVAAYKWLNLAAAHAPKPRRENYAKLRNAVASKMSPGQIASGQWYSLRWPEDSRF